MTYSTHIQDFLRSVTVVDCETTGLDATTAEIIELASGAFDGKEWQTKSLLFRPTASIPPEASAKHFISNRMVKNKPLFENSIDDAIAIIGVPSYFVAHNVHYDKTLLVSSLTRAKEDDLAELLTNDDMWICTLRLAKRIYPAQESFALQYLRYSLDLPIDDAIIGHNAESDVTVCALFLERLIKDGVILGLIDDHLPIGPQLNALTIDPILVDVWTVGKHKGTRLVDIPTDYYLWALDNMDVLNADKSQYDRDLSESVRKVLESRLV